MEKIYVRKINEVWLRVTSEPGVEMEMSDYFAYFVPGYKFMAKYKTGMWDGRRKMYNLGRKTLYVGLYDQLVKFAERNEYEIVETALEYPRIEEHNDLCREDIEKWVKELGHTSNYEAVSVYEHQLDAIYTSLNENRITLESPTSSGKSLIIYSIMRWHLEHNRKVLLIVPTTQLCEQMYSDFEDYSSKSDWNVSDNCQKLYAGFPKEFTMNVLISTWQSLIRQPVEYYSQFDVALCDEVHLAKGESITAIMEAMPEAKYRIGLTGTLDDAKANRFQICGLFGRQFSVITTRELMDQGKVVDLDIRCLILKHPKEDCDLVKKAKYADELEFVVTLPKRNEFIANLAMATKGNTIILCTWVDKHIIPLTEAIRKKANGRKVFVIHGKISPIEREKIRKALDSETGAIVIASFATCSTGINIPSIENIIFASSSKSKIRNLQSIGRGLRLKEGKTQCKLFDIADNMCVGKHENHTFKHFKVRLEQYQKEQFSYKIVEVIL